MSHIMRNLLLAKLPNNVEQFQSVYLYVPFHGKFAKNMSLVNRRRKEHWVQERMNQSNMGKRREQHLGLLG